MKALITADLHLDDLPRNEYRWKFFPYIKDLLKQYDYKYDLIVVGDLTDRKDKHSAKLVNRIIDELYEISQLTKIHLVSGNHDYIDPICPFMRFLSYIPNIEFIIQPTILTDVMVIPHTTNFLELWQSLTIPKTVKTILIHQTIKGSVVSEHYVIEEGLPLQTFDVIGNRQVLSGDIHIPQKLNDRFMYIGAPYPVNFGDNYNGRVLCLSGSDLGEVFYPCGKRSYVDIISPGNLALIDLKQGDQIKVRLKLSKAETYLWKSYVAEIKQICQERGVDLFGIELKKDKVQAMTETGVLKPEMSYGELIAKVAKKEKLSQLHIDIATSLIEEVNESTS